jgi:hypothetical protein
MPLLSLILVALLGQGQPNADEFPGLADIDLVDVGKVHVLRTDETIQVNLVAAKAAQASCPIPDPTPLSAIRFEVWLLGKDGRLVERSPGARGPYRSMQTGGAGWCLEQIIVGFRLVPTDQLAGVVVSVNGKLVAKEIVDDTPNQPATRD